MHTKLFNKRFLLTFLSIASCLVLVLSQINSNSFLQVKAEASNVTFTPQEISLTSSEIINPNRGYYKWRPGAQFYAGEVVPMSGSHTNNSNDAYTRILWDQLEDDATPGDYSKGFALIDSYAEKTKAMGGQLGFRIYVLCPECSDKIGVPEYIQKNTFGNANGWMRNGAYIPDWNNEYFLSRVQALLSALSTRYNGDPRIGVIDVGIYGLYGEWHMAGVNYPGPDGQQSITEATKGRIIDMHINAFSNKHVVVLIDKYAIIYIENKSTNVSKVGWRADCLGLLRNLPQGFEFGDKLDDAEEHFRRISTDTVRRQDGYPSWKEVWDSWLKDRWKEGIITTEFCPLYFNKFTPEGLSDVDAAYQQVVDYHVSLLSNGNVTSEGDENESKWNSFTPAQKDKLIQMGKISGYRYSISSVTIPSSLNQSSQFTIATSWKNSGVAPIYDKWDVYFQLRDPSTKTVKWEQKSSLNLKTLLPGSTALITSDNLLLDSNIPTGTYDLTVQIRDTVTNYRAPLELAMSGVQADGSYLLGSNIQVTSPNTTPTASPTPNPQCPRKPEGDADCLNGITLLDFQIFLEDFRDYLNGEKRMFDADFDGDTQVTLIDYNTWRATYVEELTK